jgi:UDP-N-acetylmuramoylalanine--D-glutamate ligase
MIAVTGSKGKSSLVKVIADTLTLAGLRAAPGGNFGTAVCTLADERPDLDWAVIECSSFQLETVDAFRPRVGIVLNLSPDHLDRHGDMATYRDTKLRMLARQASGDTALLPAGADPWGLREAHAKGAPRTPNAQCPAPQAELFGTEPDAAWRYEPGAVVRNAPDGCRIDIAGSPFDNPILGRAAAAGVAALWHAGVAHAVISQGFKTYEPLAHRMQPVAEIDGVRYVNDSKATSLTALKAAVRMLPGRKRLIAGGRLKEKISADAKELLTAGVRKAYLIGECASAMAAAWSPELDVQICGTLEAAVECAGREAEPGETVLLSPGTASFDQFRDFQDRGNAFMALVQRLRDARHRTQERTE